MENTSSSASSSSGKLRIKGILARPIRKGTDHIVKGMWVIACNIMILQHRAKERLAPTFQPNRGPVNINPCFRLMLKGTVKLVRMTDSASTTVANGIKKLNGLMTVPLLHSQRGKKVMKLLPFGETTVALSECLGKLLAALKLDTKIVLKDFAWVTSSLMAMRYGEDVHDVTHHTLEICGRVLHILWNVIGTLDPFNLPLDGINECHDFYESLGVDELEEAIEAHVDQVEWPKVVEEIKKYIEKPQQILGNAEALATHEKKFRENRG